MPQAVEKFWQQNPALFYALAALLGCFLALEFSWLLLIPVFMLWGCPLIFHGNFTKSFFVRLGIAFITMAGTYAYVTMQYRFPVLPAEGAIGNAQFEIQSFSVSTTHFGKFWVYKGVLKDFTPDNPEKTIQSGHNIPVRLTLPVAPELHPPSADSDYLVHGRLKETKPGQYSFHVKKEELWHPVAGTWSLSQLRYKAKTAVSAYIQRHIQDTRVAVFLSGIATGDFDDRLMSFEFGRFGLQHIMAISGFHFAIIAAILSLFLRLVMSKRKATLLLIFLLSSYFMFLGCGPSVMRAWITIMIALAGYLLARRGNGLNSLGLALLAIILYDPLMCRSIGFQFSFIATAAILMLFRGCDWLIQNLFRKRNLSQMVLMNGLDQHGYFLLSWVRQGMALALAVNLAALPLMLYYFHKFPLMSLGYNLFFPFMVSVSMLLLILGVIGSLILPPLGSFLHFINDHYTRFLLNFTYNMPATVDITWRVESFPTYLLVLHLCLIFWLGIWLREQAERRQEDLADLAFI